MNMDGGDEVYLHHSQPQHYMEDSQQLLNPAALPPGKLPSVHTV
jgi:hypothetical protein